VHRVAANHLLTTRKRRAEQVTVSLEVLATHIEAGLACAVAAPSIDTSQAVLSEEVRISCTQAMLLCLDREHRLAFILGEIFELTGEEAAFVLEITPGALRKRISRAQKAIIDFMKGRCGVYDAENPCRCSLQVPYAIRTGMLDPSRLRFATHPARTRRDPGVQAQLDDLIGLLDAAAIYRSHPDYVAPSAFVQAIKDLLEPPKLRN
jgi:hypothetical protein